MSLIPTGPPPIIPQRRSAAQRAAAQRLLQPKQPLPPERAAPAPLIGSEDFYRRKQEGIKNYRTAYDSRVGAHFDALAGRADTTTAAPPAPTDAIGALAHENASRHVAPIGQFVRGEAGPARSRRPGA